MSEEFMLRMVSSYDGVHNKRYWDEIEHTISKEELQDETIMDLGCGPGLLLKDLAEKYEPQTVVGIDISDIMLDRAKQELEKFAPDIEIELINQHLQDNPILPRKAKAIFSSRVLRSFEEQHVIMQSIHNSLQEGGYLVILDWTKSSIETYAKWFQRDKNDFEQLSPADIIKYHRNFSRYDLQDWRYILESFDFEVVHQFQLGTVHSVTIATKN